jgi:hypothetical protein
MERLLGQRRGLDFGGWNSLRAGFYEEDDLGETVRRGNVEGELVELVSG